MDSGKASLKKKSNELGSKDDLEWFYVALPRKMYDKGEALLLSYFTLISAYFTIPRPLALKR
jgi:hypothetical protein